MCVCEREQERERGREKEREMAWLAVGSLFRFNNSSLKWINKKIVH